MNRNVLPLMKKREKKRGRDRRASSFFRKEPLPVIPTLIVWRRHSNDGLVKSPPASTPTLGMVSRIMDFTRGT